MYYDDHTEAKLGKVKDPVVRVIKWIKSRSPREKGIMGCLGGLLVCPTHTCTGPTACSFYVILFRDFPVVLWCTGSCMALQWMRGVP